MQKYIPEKYEKDLVLINIPGVTGYAWRKDTFLEFLNDEESKFFAILGGDVLKVENGKMAYTYDSWSVDKRNVDESFEDYCKRTIETAKSYVESYSMNGEILFAPVLNSEITAGL